MLNFEEELKKFQPSLEVDEIEAEAISEDLTDLSDLLKISWIQRVRETERFVWISEENCVIGPCTGITMD